MTSRVGMCAIGTRGADRICPGAGKRVTQVDDRLLCSSPGPVSGGGHNDKWSPSVMILDCARAPYVLYRCVH